MQYSDKGKLGQVCVSQRIEELRKLIYGMEYSIGLYKREIDALLKKQEQQSYIDAYNEGAVLVGLNDLLDKELGLEDAELFQELTVQVEYSFTLGGYKWREVKKVRCVDDVDAVVRAVDEQYDPDRNSSVDIVPAFTQEDLDDLEVDYDKQKVDIDLSEAGDGVHHRQQCPVTVYLFKRIA